MWSQPSSLSSVPKILPFLPTTGLKATSEICPQTRTLPASCSQVQDHARSSFATHNCTFRHPETPPLYLLAANFWQINPPGI